ncbi:hypothetical protein ACFQXA_12420 [Nocardiopsis composta]
MTPPRAAEALRTEPEARASGGTMAATALDAPASAPSAWTRSPTRSATSPPAARSSWSTTRTGRTRAT